MVEFLPDSEKGNPGPRATGKTDAQGRYHLSFDNQKPGAVAGKNRVLVHDLKVYGDKFEGRKAKKVAASRVPAIMKMPPERLFNRMCRVPRRQLLIWI
jgi:hypothetical protein